MSEISYLYFCTVLRRLRLQPRSPAVCIKPLLSRKPSRTQLDTQFAGFKHNRMSEGAERTGWGKMIKNSELAGWFLKWLSSHKSAEDSSSCHFKLTNKPFDPSLYYNERRADTRDQYSAEQVTHLFLRQFQDIGRLCHSQPSHVSTPCPK